MGTEVRKAIEVVVEQRLGRTLDWQPGRLGLRCGSDAQCVMLHF